MHIFLSSAWVSSVGSMLKRLRIVSLMLFSADSSGNILTFGLSPSLAMTSFTAERGEMLELRVAIGRMWEGFVRYFLTTSRVSPFCDIGHFAMIWFSETRRNLSDPNWDSNLVQKSPNLSAKIFLPVSTMS